jgi:ATP-dependent DNA helicase DinG
MADAVEEALARDRPLFVEAGTGTGKTLAYLVPAILSGRKVVVSTATKALQEQIFAKDLPLVAEVLAAHGVTFRAALMKGLTNYLCRRRFEELRVNGGGGPMMGRLERWALLTETGDRSELADLPEDAPIWQSVQSSTDTRIGAPCPHYDACFVTRMRKEAEAAQIVVVNHHLFLADLALKTGRGEGFAGALPPYDAVVFDEAHQIEDIATDFFGVRASGGRVTALLRDAERTLAAAGKLELLQRSGARALLDSTEEAARAFFGALAQLAGRAGEARRVLAPEDFSGKVLEAYHALDARLAALQAHAQETAASNEGIALIGRRAVDLRRDLDEIIQGTRAAARPKDEADESGVVDRDARVAWLDVRERTVSIGASPIDLGPTLRRRLFDRVSSVICTSATLATGKSFHFAKSRLGAPPDVAELVVDSPFDYASRAALYLPRDLPEPTDARFEAAAAERVTELVGITQGGAFVLCTSTRAMRALHAALEGRLPARMPLFVQGEAPKHLLLSRFRAANDAVLVATMSFWEGVDVPGHALRLVIIDKLPFAVPTDPVVAARCRDIDRNGGNAFAQYSVPAAAITLKQGFGRLLRTQKDSGIVAILDKRIVTRGYGRALVASLPPARRVHDLPALRGFWDGLGV